MKTIELKNKTIIELKPKSPYNFDANFHKPSHFPSSDNIWEKGKYWITMIWEGQELGLKFENKGTVDSPKIKIYVYSKKPLSKDFIDNLIPEIRWRFNFDSDISDFCERYKKDKIFGPVIKKWKGMKPIAANSLYESLIIYIVLQNATVRRSVQMLENLFKKLGKRIKYDDKVLSTFWKPEKMAKTSEQELRDLKVGYRAKFFKRISEQFANKEIDEFALRKMTKGEVKKEMIKLYGIGPASIEYLLFEDFYFCDALATIPPWEQKIMSRLIFNKKLVSTKKILDFFKKFKNWEKLAFHYIWEDIFWKRKYEHIEWLEKEIRL
jgi:3-methyladenine DNA glycosylase/8-oxoguanine DNA glycosylase